MFRKPVGEKETCILNLSGLLLNRGEWPIEEEDQLTRKRSVCQPPYEQAFLKLCLQASHTYLVVHSKAGQRGRSEIRIV